VGTGGARSAAPRLESGGAGGGARGALWGTRGTPSVPTRGSEKSGSPCARTQPASERSPAIARWSTDPPALTTVRCEEAHPPKSRTALPAAASVEASGRSIPVAQHRRLRASAPILRGSLELPEKRYALGE